MTDQEVLAYEHEHDGDPYMTLAKAKELHRVALQFWHLGQPRRCGSSGSCNRRPRIQSVWRCCPSWVIVA
jgi:hypothetical protein